MSKIFDIISFTADRRQYYPAGMGKQSWMKENHVPHTSVDIPMGASRYGGPVMDLPPGIEPPPGLRFAAQLDLAAFSPSDKTGLLSKTGQLIFFADLINETGMVFYSDTANDQLIRTVHEHEDHFFLGVLIDQVFADTETISQRLRKATQKWELEDADSEGMVWDEFAGSEQSKIFGLYTHCQRGQQEIEQVLLEGKFPLLQIGENGFNDEGVFTVLIKQTDLAQMNFNNCEFSW